MKYLRYLLLLLLLIPTVVFAKVNSVEVVDIERIEKSDNVIVVSDEEVSNSTISFNLKFFEVNDYITYKVTVKNTSGEKIKIESGSDVLTSKYLSYEASLEDNNLEVNEETELLLKVSYFNNLEREDIRNGAYVEEQNIDINIVNGKLVVSNKGVVDYDEQINPITQDVIIGILIVCGISFALFMIFKNKEVSKYSLLLVLLIPMYTNAVDSIKVNSIIEVKLVKPNPCTTGSNSFVKDQYAYYYEDNLNGWHLTLLDKNSTDPVTSKVCTTINGEPIVSMAGAFYQAQTTSVDLSSFDTSNVVNMSGMFSYASGISELDLITFDTRQVKVMSSMFSGLNKIEKLDLSTFDTSNVELFGSMFYGMSSLTELNLNNWDFSHVSSPLKGAFSSSPEPSLKVLKLENTKFTGSLENGFSYFSSLEELDLANADVSEVTDLSNTFTGMYALKKLDLTGWDTSNVTSMKYAFSNLLALEELDITSFDTSNVTDMNHMFYHCESLAHIDVSNFNVEKVIDMSYMFSNMKNLEEIDVTNFKTSSLLGLNDFVSDCPKITELDLSSFDTTHLTGMPWYIMANDPNVQVVNLSNWDLTMIEDYQTNSLGRMLGGSSYALDYGNNANNWGIKKIIMKNVIFPENASGLFAYISTLEEIDLENADGSRVKNVMNMFSGDNSLKSVDLSFLSDSKLTDMKYMFKFTYALDTIDLSPIDISENPAIYQMFSGTGATVGYAKDQEAADYFNSVAPDTLRFTVK